MSGFRAKRNNANLHRTSEQREKVNAINRAYYHRVVKPRRITYIQIVSARETKEDANPQETTSSEACCTCQCSVHCPVAADPRLHLGVMPGSSKWTPCAKKMA